MKANLSPEAGRILDAYLASQGITLGTYLEALAFAIAETPEVAPTSEEILRRAREIAYERGRRKH